MLKVKPYICQEKGGFTMDHDPLLLLDNGTLAYILGDGDYRFTNIKFEEAKAIMEMKGTADIVRLFANPDLEHTMSEYLGIEKQEFTYDPEQELHVGQDAIVFMLLEKGAKAEVSEIFERCGLTPKIHFTTWDDYAIMSMVESDLGISILPQLILKRVPYHIVAKELDVPAYRKIGLALREKKTASLAVKRFMEYLQYR